MHAFSEPHADLKIAQSGALVAAVVFYFWELEQMAWRIEHPVETIVGAAVLSAAAFFAYFASQAGGGSIGDGYRLSAQFSSATGVTVGTDVRVAGVKVGRVSALDLDPDTYQAKLELTLRGAVQLPTDTLAKVANENLLGGSFISLEPGADESMLVEGDSLQLTQGAPDLLDLLQQFGGGSSSGGSSGADSSSSDDQSSLDEGEATEPQEAALDVVSPDNSGLDAMQEPSLPDTEQGTEFGDAQLGEAPSEESLAEGAELENSLLDAVAPDGAEPGLSDQNQTEARAVENSGAAPKTE